MRFELSVGDKTVHVTETPRFERDGERLRLVRTLEASGSKDVTVSWTGWVRALASRDDVSAPGSQTLQVTKILEEAGGLDAKLDVVLAADTPATVTVHWKRALVHARHELEQKRKADTSPTVEAKPKPKPPEPHPDFVPTGAGVSVRVYSIGQSMAQIPQLVAGQTPNVSRILPRLDLHGTRGDFGALEDEFVTHVDGFLEVPADGKYAFQLISDDGSKLYLNDKLVVDHDGLHGPTEMDGEVELTAGRHKLFVEHFENGGGDQLTLRWKPPGASSFALVPMANLRAPKGEVRVTSPGHKKIRATKRRGTPGDGEPLTRVHPSFDLTGIRPEGFEPRVGGMDWLPDGRLVICCWETEGGVYLLDNVRKSATGKPTVKQIAAGLSEPLGLRVVDGRIYVLQKQELTELIDHDGDEVIDEYRCVSAGWGVTPNFHEFAFGLVHKDGKFYATLATAIEPGGASSKNQNIDRGRVIEIEPSGAFRFIAAGLRTPNGIGLGVDDEIFVTDNQGDWLPVSKVLHVTKDAFFGNRSVEPERSKDYVEKPPVVWLPQGEIGNSPGEPGVLLEGPYKGQMAHCDITHGGLKRVFVENVNGEYQGCVFRFIQGLEAGTNRWTRGPDGSLYVGGIGSTGNWGQTGKKRFGLERLDFNGKDTFDWIEMRMGTWAFQMTFTQPLAPQSGESVNDYTVTQWRYVPTAQYGGPKKDIEELTVKSVLLSEDRKTVTLGLLGMKPGHVVHARLAPSIRNAAGERPWSVEGWYTLNQIPTWAFQMGPKPKPQNVLTDAEKAAGWKLLFDGETTNGWRGYKRKDVPAAWSAADGTLVFDPKSKDRGDLITNETYGSFELSLEWKVAKNGNSGICYRFNEEGGAMWATGVEMQVLDNAGHPDGGKGLTSAGSAYALVAPTMDVSRGPNRWNLARIVARGDKVEHWLNGWKIAEYDRSSEDWKQRIAKSKFATMAGFAVPTAGHIGVQDHGDVVAYRNVKLRVLE